MSHRRTISFALTVALASMVSAAVTIAYGPEQADVVGLTALSIEQLATVEQTSTVR